MAKPLKPPCGACLANRQKIVPTYASCKAIRLCDRVDPGLLRFRPELITLEEYEDTHDRLLRGMSELEGKQEEPLPADADAFIALVQDAHRTLFQYAMPQTAGRFRGPGEDVTFGGTRRHQRHGFAHDRIDPGVRAAFAMANRNDWALARRAAAFLAHFFRVHPFMDGNGRIGRFVVQKICRASGKTIPEWSTTGQSRRRYISGLEYAHRLPHHPEKGLAFLERWLAVQIHDLPGPGDPDIF